jgi:hypothetical protein
MIGGAWLSKREREKSGLGWLGAGWADWLPGCSPVGLLASFFYFFPSAFLFFYSEFLFGVLKRFFNSDLNNLKLTTSGL